MTRKLLLIAYCVIGLGYHQVQAQRYTYWNQLVNWNGITHWSQYMRYAPAYFGPNALPVPEMPDAILRGKAYLESRLMQHNLLNDRTTNLFLKAVFPLGENAQLELSGVPLEYYHTDSATRDLRRARNPEKSGWATGDLYFGTRVQLMQERGGFPAISLGLYGRTASGGKLDDARYTDAPGYWFDLCASEEVGPVIGRKTWIRWKALVGFYSWQTASDEYRQNDAIMAGGSFGIGEPGKYWLDTELSGYFGYIGNGDQPIVWRLNYKEFGKKHNWGLMFQQGLHNYPFTSIGISRSLNLPRFSRARFRDVGFEAY